MIFGILPLLVLRLLGATGVGNEMSVNGRMRDSEVFGMWESVFAEYPDVLVDMSSVGGVDRLCIDGMDFCRMVLKNAEVDGVECCRCSSYVTGVMGLIEQVRPSKSVCIVFGNGEGMYPGRDDGMAFERGNILRMIHVLGEVGRKIRSLVSEKHGSLKVVVSQVHRFTGCRELFGNVMRREGESGSGSENVVVVSNNSMVPLIGSCILKSKNRWYLLYDVPGYIRYEDASQCLEHDKLPLSNNDVCTAGKYMSLLKVQKILGGELDVRVAGLAHNEGERNKICGIIRDLFEGDGDRSKFVEELVRKLNEHVIRMWRAEWRKDLRY